MNLINSCRPQVVLILDTRTRVEATDPIIKRLPYTGRVVAPSFGQAGGIWIIWNPNEIKATTLLLAPRMIHVRIEYQSTSTPFNFTAVYNYPNPNHQYQVWQMLEYISNTRSGPWLITGDFNVILYPH